MKRNLLKAIELAKGAGSCQYIKGGEPCCVIAQLYVLEGGKVEDMEGWGNNWSNTTVDAVIRKNLDNGVLKKYDRQLLTRLQNTWDNFEDDEEDKRVYMVGLVEEYCK